MPQHAVQLVYNLVCSSVIGNNYHRTFAMNVHLVISVRMHKIFLNYLCYILIIMNYNRILKLGFVGSRCP
jgi:hypothetical protein